MIVQGVVFRKKHQLMFKMSKDKYNEGLEKFYSRIRGLVRYKKNMSRSQQINLTNVMEMEK